MGMVVLNVIMDIIEMDLIVKNVNQNVQHVII